MSVLNLPRLNFTGEVLWNPDTANNSPGVYNENTLKQNPDIPPDTFVKWLTSLNASPPAGQQSLNGSWNVYGDSGCWFRNAKIVGVQTAYGQTATDDPICNDDIKIQIVGEFFRDTGRPAPARMCDVAPYQSTTTQIFFKWLQLGTDELGFRAEVRSPMYLRWSMLRNTDFDELIIAGVAGVIMQTSALDWDIKWFGLERSPALKALRKAVNDRPTNLGMAMQFAIYRTQYYKNASFNGKPIENPADLAQAYADGFTGPNPAQSMITGTIGVWGEHELETGPAQILLKPLNPVAPLAPALPTARAVQEGMVAAAAQPPQPRFLGPAVASIDAAAGNLAVSFVTTILETNLAPDKENLGPIQLQVLDGLGEVHPIATIPYSAYDRRSYQKTSGILDFPLTSDQMKLLTNRANALQLFVPEAGDKGVVALRQTPLVVETDERGVYLDQGETKTVTIRIYDNGAPAGTNVFVLVSQYYEAPLDPSNSFPYYLVTPGNQGQACLAFDDKKDHIVVRVVNDGGWAKFDITSVAPGTAMLGYQPFYVGTAEPAPLPGGPGNFPGPETANYYSVVRCLGFDNLMLEIPDDQVNWTNTYNMVLQTYNLVYPEMSRIRNLADANVVKGMAEQILAATEYPHNFKWTMFMPVSREMSAGKRNLLRRFCAKVLNNEI